MAKVLKTVAVIASVVALTLAIPGVGTALGLSAATASTIATVATITSLAAGLGAAALARRPTFSREGNPLQFQTNPQSGLPYPMGRTRMSGVRIHADTYDAPSFKSESKQDILSFAVLLGAGGPMEEIETFRADKEAVTFDPTTGNTIGTYSNWMAQKVSLGLAGASALALAFGGGNFPGWTTDHKLSGISHGLWDLRYDPKGDHFAAGVPEPEWIGKWVKVYDPRLDSTYPGGSGSHRALDESTYEWSANPALHALTWALGRWQNGKRTLGIGAPVANIRVADFVGAANVADANEWTCGGVEWSTDSKWTILKKILQAGGAEPTMAGAMIGCRVNTPRVSIATVTADKLIDHLTVSTTRSRRDRFNTVIPRYRSEDHDWEIISGSTVSVSEYVTEDGGPRTKEIDFPLVQKETGGNGDEQAGQLAAYEIVNSREAGPIQFSTGPEFIGIKTGDCITLDVPDEGLDAQPVLVRSRSIDPATLKISFEVETETDAKHDFALGKTTVPPPTYEPTAPDLTPPTPNESLWTLSAPSDAVTPSIVIAGVCEFPGADAVLLEYKKTADSEWLTLGKAEASAPVNQTISSLDGSTQYEARVAYQSGNRVGDWLELDAVTTAADQWNDFNAQNNRNADAIAAATILTNGTAVDHTTNLNASIDLSFEWVWGGTEGDIDGFEVMLYAGASSSAYTPGTSPALEHRLVVPANVRAAFVRGIVSNLYYTWAVRAYRKVDADISASGVIVSAWAKPSIAAENPYLPSANVSFGGNVTGTIDSTSAANVAAWSAYANAGLNADGTVKPDKVPAGGVQDAALIAAGYVEQGGTWALTSSDSALSPMITGMLMDGPRLQVYFQWFSSMAITDPVEGTEYSFTVRGYIRRVTADLYYYSPAQTVKFRWMEPNRTGTYYSPQDSRLLNFVFDGLANTTYDVGYWITTPSTNGLLGYAYRYLKAENRKQGVE